MALERTPDAVIGRIVVEFTKEYYILYSCRHDGVIVDADAFKFPAKLDKEEATQERDITYGALYDLGNDTYNMDLDHYGGDLEDELDNHEEQEK